MDGKRGLGRMIRCIFVVIALVLAVGCEAGESPVAVTKRFWNAWQEGDRETMLKCIEPERRDAIDPFLCVVPGGELGLILSRGLKLQVTDLEFTILDKNGSQAHVEVKGYVKVPEDIALIGGMVRAFRVTHSLVQKDGNWYLTCP